MGLQRRADRGEQVQPSGAPPRLRVRRGADGSLEIQGPGGASPPEVAPGGAAPVSEREAGRASVPPRDGADDEASRA